jgi:hypothetical protein
MAAVDARIATYWAGTYLGLNESAETPADGGAFLTVQYPLANATQISIGSPGAEVFREEGGIRFVYSIPRGSGVAYWQGLLEALLGHFRAAKFDGVNTWAPTSPVFDNSNDQGTYWLLAAVVPYFADVLG